jgi:hypothetical protein
MEGNGEKKAGPSTTVVTATFARDDNSFYFRQGRVFP